MAVSIVPTNLQIGKNGNATFTAMASGINKKNFVYQWKKRGDNSLPNKVSGINEDMLIIPNAVESDGGQYYCTVTNQWQRSVESNDVTLTVYGT